VIWTPPAFGYAGATEAPQLSADEPARVAELYERNFDVASVSAQALAT
jgi:hypothetical protein